MDRNLSTSDYIGYDYIEVNTRSENASMYLDGYMSFGWTQDENVPPTGSSVRLKRDRKIMNKAELTRLQRHFNACIGEIGAMERSKASTATMISILIGVIGIAFIAGSVFAITAATPIVWLMVVLAVPGFACCASAMPAYKVFYRKGNEKLSPLIEAKYDEIYEICEKGHRLLSE